MTTATQWTKAEESSDAADNLHGPRLPNWENLTEDEEGRQDLSNVDTIAEGAHSEFRDNDVVMEQSEGAAPANVPAYELEDVELEDAPEGPDQVVKKTAADKGGDDEMTVDNPMGDSTAVSRWWGEGTFNPPQVWAFPSGDYGSNLSTTGMPPDTVRINVRKSDSKLVMDVEGDNAMLCAQIKPELKRLCSKYASFSGSTIDLSDPWERVEAMIGGNIPVSVLQSGANIQYSRSPALDDAFCQHVATALTSPE